jgi:hemolysin activation/secretion protein
MRAAIFWAAGLLLPAAAIAQNVGQGPNYQIPGAPNYQPPVIPPPKPPPAYQLPPLPPEPAGVPAAGSGGQMFVKRIEVRGVTAFKPAQVAALAAPYENRIVTGAQLQSLRVALTRLYVDKGYINSGVLLPDQKPTDGVVVFQAVEGKLTRVIVGGKTKLRHRYVESRLRAHVSEPLNVADLKYALRYVQQDQNVQRLDASLGPGDTPGEAVLRVNVEEPPRFSVGAGVDNYQSSSIGETLGMLNLGARDLTGYGDDLRASIGHSDGDTLGSAVWTVPVSARDASVQLYYSRADAAIIEQPFEPLDIKETIRIYGLNLTVPVVDRLDHRFSLFFGAESDRSFTELLGMPFSFSPGAENGVSAAAVLLGGLDWLHHGTSSVTDLRLTYRRGVDALGATINTPESNTTFNPNPTGADGRFGLEQLQFINIVRLNGFSAFSHLNDRAQFIVRVSGQITQNPLLALEKFTVGGVETVRGYPENLLVRDNGYAGTLELQLPLPGYRAQAYPGNLVFAPFVDYGRSWDKVNITPGNPLVDTSTPVYIASAGLGLLWNPLRGLDAQVYWGRGIANNFGADNPLHYAPHDLQYHGIFYALNYAYRW